MPTPQFPQRATRESVEITAEEGRPLRHEPNEPANDQAPASKYFSGKALAEFCRVWDSLNGKGVQP